MSSIAASVASASLSRHPQMADRIGRPRQRIGFPWVAATPGSLYRHRQQSGSTRRKAGCHRPRALTHLRCAPLPSHANDWLPDDFRRWHFCDMARDANEVRSKPGSGHPCDGPRKARLWVHGQISQTVLFLFAPSTANRRLKWQALIEFIR
jgi:hypothetical protein